MGYYFVDYYIDEIFGIWDDRFGDIIWYDDVWYTPQIWFENSGGLFLGLWHSSCLARSGTHGIRTLCINRPNFRVFSDIRFTVSASYRSEAGMFQIKSWTNQILHNVAFGCFDIYSTTFHHSSRRLQPYHLSVDRLWFIIYYAKICCIALCYYIAIIHILYSIPMIQPFWLVHVGSIMHGASQGLNQPRFAAPATSLAGLRAPTYEGRSSRWFPSIFASFHASKIF